MRLVGAAGEIVFGTAAAAIVCGTALAVLGSHALARELRIDQGTIEMLTPGSG